MNDKITVRNNNNCAIDLLINGEIDNFWGINLESISSQIQNSKANLINVQINSGGGSVIEGQAIAAYLKGSKAVVNTSGLGLVGSIATIILLAGRNVSMAEHGYFMIHNPTAGLYGDSTELRHTADLLDTIQEDLANTYVDAIEKNGKLIDGSKEKTKKEVIKMMDDETWLTAQQAYDMGFIDSVTKGVNFVNKTQAKEILNTCKNYKNAPIDFLNNIQKVAEMSEQTQPTIWESIKAFFTSKEGKTLIKEVQNEAAEAEAQEIERAKELAKKHGFFREEAATTETVVTETPTTEPAQVQNNAEVETLKQRIKELEEKNAAPSTGGDKTEALQNKQTERDKVLAKHKDALADFATIFKV